MTDGFRCDGCDEWFEQDFRLLEAGFDPEATAHPSLSLDDVGPDANELLPDDGRGDFCPRCGRKAIETLVELFDQDGEAEEAENPYEPTDLGTFTVESRDQEWRAGVWLNSTVARHFGDVDRVHVRERDDRFELAPGRSDDWPDHSLNYKGSWLGPKAMDVLDVVDGDEVVATPDGDVVVLKPRRVAERPPDEGEEAEEEDVPDHIREALPDSSHSGDMLILEYEERFLDIEFEEVPCGECGETVEHQIETDSYLGEKTTECSNCNATDAVDVDAILEEGADARDEEDGDEDGSEDGEVLGTYEVREYESATALNLGQPVARRIDADRVTVRAPDGDPELVDGDVGKWPDYSVAHGRIQIGGRGLRVIGASPGDEVTAIVDGDTIRLDVEGVQREVPPPEEADAEDEEEEDSDISESGDAGDDSSEVDGPESDDSSEQGGEEDLGPGQASDSSIDDLDLTASQREILEHLREEGEASSGVVKTVTGIKTVWKQLRDLQERGLVEARKDPDDGRRKLYRPADGPGGGRDDDEHESGEAVGESGDGEDRDRRRCGDCAVTFETGLEHAIHRTEEHDIPQFSLNYLEAGEFEAIVNGAESVGEIVEETGWSTERVLRVLNIYGLEEIVGPSGVELSDLSDWEFEGVATNGDEPPTDAIGDEEAAEEFEDRVAADDAENEEETKYGHLVEDRIDEDPSGEAAHQGRTDGGAVTATGGGSSTHSQRICQNCESHVSKAYARVHAPDEEKGPRVCPNCPDRVRDGPDVREARSTRRTGR